MDKEVVWTLSAAADLEAIVEYIFRDSEFYATAVAGNCWRRLGLSPLFLNVGEWCRSMKIPRYDK